MSLHECIFVEHLIILTNELFGLGKLFVSLLYVVSRIDSILFTLKMNRKLVA